MNILKKVQENIKELALKMNFLKEVQEDLKGSITTYSGEFLVAEISEIREDVAEISEIREEILNPEKINYTLFTNPLAIREGLDWYYHNKRGRKGLWKPNSFCCAGSLNDIIVGDLVNVDLGNQINLPTIYLGPPKSHGQPYFIHSPWNEGETAPSLLDYTLVEPSIIRTDKEGLILYDALEEKIWDVYYARVSGDLKEEYREIPKYLGFGIVGVAQGFVNRKKKARWIYRNSEDLNRAIREKVSELGEHSKAVEELKEQYPDLNARILDG